MPSVFERITAFNENRLPVMLAIKYKTMCANSFSFFRGTCHLFYEDLYKASNLQNSPLTWICGDLHLENFGSFKGDDHQVYFDLNDFDEAILAPAIWELLRMVTSIFVAFDNLNLDEAEAYNLAHKYLHTYTETLKRAKAIAIDPRTAKGIVCDFLTKVEKRKQKDLLKKRTTKVNGHYAFLNDKIKSIALNKELKMELVPFVENWMKSSIYANLDFKVIDSVFRIAGTGSIGAKRYLFLLESKKNKTKYLFLDMKQAFKSSIIPYSIYKQPGWANEAERAIAIKQRMQNVNPALLGTGVFKDEPFIIQQMQPTEDKIRLELIKYQYQNIHLVIEDMAQLTASAQLRSTGRQGSAITDELIYFAQNGDWHQVLDYAKNYSQQVKSDFEKFKIDYNNFYTSFN